MMHLAAYGRLGQPPREIETSTGKTMAVGSIACTLVDRHGTEHVQWIGLLAFGRVAETLLKHDKGELISASGRVQANVYQGRVELQIVVDSVVSSRSVRSGGGKRKGAQPASNASREPLDDEVPL